MKKYQDLNAKIIDSWVEKDWEWGRPISHEVFVNAKKGIWDVVLTPTKPVPHAWFPHLSYKKVLGLASGGGQQMPIFKALGAEITVLDYSLKQLENEKIVAEREGYTVQLIRADMTQKLPFPDDTFDLIFHPVSNCYVKDVKSIFKECFRVLKKGGILLSGLGNEVNYMVNDDETTIVNKLPFDPLKDEKLFQQSIDLDWGIAFSHTLEEQIGGQLEAGFILTHIYDDTNGQGRLHDLNIQSFFATRSIKP